MAAPFRVACWAALLLAVAPPFPLAAQSFDGTYLARGSAGDVTLTLNQTNGGDVIGSLAGNGVEFPLTGSVQDGVLVGTVKISGEAAYFEGDLEGSILYVTIANFDADGEPNWEAAEELEFSAAGSTTAGRSPLAALTGGAPPVARVGGASDPMLGLYGTPSGASPAVTLELDGGGGQYQGQMIVNGTPFQFVAQGGPAGIQATVQAADGNYPLTAQPSANGLRVSVAGMQFHLARQGSSGGDASVPPSPPRGTDRPEASSGTSSTGLPLAPGFTEDHPGLQQWYAHLSGKKLTQMESYSSSGGGFGGYSSRQEAVLCSDRRFRSRSSSSVSVDVGGAFGNSNGANQGTGRWMLITNGQLVGLVLVFDDGSTMEFRLEMNSDGGMYANGTRTFVTPAEVCP